MHSSFRAALAAGPLVADGAMGTALRAASAQPGNDTSLEQLNLDAPDMVVRVHESYIAAGADLLQTNTYGANALQLERHGQSVLLREVNARAVELARTAARQADRPLWIAGSLGPLGAIRYEFDVLRTDAIAAVYARQLAVLAEAGVDLFIFDTMDDYREIVGALRAAQKLGLPAVLQVASPDGETVGGRIDLAAVLEQVERWGGAAIGANCRLGPVSMTEVARRLIDLTTLPVSIQPNAGNYVVDGYGRLTVTGDVAQYRAMAEACLDMGVRILGGCCYTTPSHIEAARTEVDHWLRSRPEPARCGVSIGSLAASVSERPDTDGAAKPPVVSSAPARRVPSKLERALAAGRFITCVEVDPPTDEECRTDPGILGLKIDGARYLERRCGVDLITIADHTMGQPWLDPFPFAEALRPHLRTADLLLHYSCRNKAETDITGNFASFRIYGYKNVLVITGDRPKSPEMKSFFVYSSPTLIERIRREHGDFFLLAASFDHTRGIERGGTFGIDAEVRRLERKVAAGARLFLTQPMFPERLVLLREKTRDIGVPIFPGVMPILSAAHGRNLNANFPGMHIPDDVILQLEAAGDDRRQRARIAIEVATTTAQMVRDLGFPGIYLIMSLNRFDVIKEIIVGMRQPTPSGHGTS